MTKMILHPDNCYRSYDELRRQEAPMCAVASRPLAMLMTLATLLLMSCGGGGISFSQEQEPRVSIALSAQAVNSTTIRLDWSGLAAAPTRYEVYQNGTYAVSLPSPGVSAASLAPR